MEQPNETGRTVKMGSQRNTTSYFTDDALSPEEPSTASVQENKTADEAALPGARIQQHTYHQLSLQNESQPTAKSEGNVSLFVFDEEGPPQNPSPKRVYNDQYRPFPLGHSAQEEKKGGLPAELLIGIRLYPDSTIAVKERLGGGAFGDVNRGEMTPYF